MYQLELTGAFVIFLEYPTETLFDKRIEYLYSERQAYGTNSLGWINRFLLIIVKFYIIRSIVTFGGELWKLNRKEK